MNVICFDIEAADNGEILELSVFSYPDIKEVYHSLFKPQHTQEWETTERIHHITPQMVASAPAFASQRSKVQRLIDNCQLIVGFAIDNDLRYLEKEEITISDKKAVVDVRDLFFITQKERLQLEYGNVPRLSKCAEFVGLDFTEEEDAHSATNDTRVTLQLFSHLLNDFNGGKLTNTLHKEIETQMEELHEEVIRKNARGILRLQPCQAGYKLRNNRLPEENEPITHTEGEYTIQVESRFLAEHDIRTLFARRADKLNPSIFRLRQSDIDKFLAYTNSYNAVQEMVYRNRYGYRRNKVNLGFHI